MVKTGQRCKYLSESRDIQGKVIENNAPTYTNTSYLGKKHDDSYKKMEKNYLFNRGFCKFCYYSAGAYIVIFHL